MLSPGNYHKQIPKDLLGNLHWRQWALNKARGDRAVQAAFFHACKNDLLFYINGFVWQFNPRKKGGGEAGPFITWPFQDQALQTMLECVETDEDLTIEKSREMGASWMILLCFEWLWHFHPWKKFLMISRSEDAVESDDPDSLFWKLDFVHRYLPTWLMPKGFKRRKLFFGNDLPSTLTGQASTGRAGVGGRATAMGVDEFSQIKEDYEVLHRTSDTTGCRIFNFTHLGLETAAYELTQRVDMRKLKLHWTQHPDKNKGLYRYNPDSCKIDHLRYNDVTDEVEVVPPYFDFGPTFKFVMDGTPTGGPHPGVRSPWYDLQCLRKGSARAIAMDLDINPTGAMSQFFDPILVRQLKLSFARAADWEGDITYDKETGRPLALEKRAGGPLKLWCNLRDGKPPVSRYGIGADIGAGTGATESCLSVANGRTGDKVAEYANAHIDPKDFGTLAVALCFLFVDENDNGARLCWEANGPGSAFGKQVWQEIGYRNIYYRTNENELAQRISDTPGWGASGASKRILLEDYRGALKSRRFLNYSERALDECLAIKYDAKGGVVNSRSYNRDDPSGARENHADRVIADALANKMVNGLLEKIGKDKPKEHLDVRSLAGRRLYHQQQLQEEVWS